MNDRLIIQSHGDGDDLYHKWLALSRPVHEDYAQRCGADYLLFVGWKEPTLHPAWNRIPMFLDAFAAGYRKVVWLDADSLVVNPARDIFAATADDVALQMTRVKDWFWRTENFEGYNDGVLVANNSHAAVDAFEYVWANRTERPADHHITSLWELSWLLDWCVAHPDCVRTLSPVFNWQPFAENLYLADQAVICSWHGVSHTNDERYELFARKYAETYGMVA